VRIASWSSRIAYAELVLFQSKIKHFPGDRLSSSSAYPSTAKPFSLDTGFPPMVGSHTMNEQSFFCALILMATDTCSNNRVDLVDPKLLIRSNRRRKLIKTDCIRSVSISDEPSKGIN
jgi:hypothetical protein